MNVVNLKINNASFLVLNTYATEGRPKTALNASADSSDTTITVFSISGFVKGNFYAQIGETGSGNAEIVKMHASTDPTGNTITLAAGLANNHDANEPVYFLNYNRIEFSRSATATGTKAVLATNDIDPTKLYTIYLDGANTTGFGFVRFNNEDGSTFSGYSAAAPYANAGFSTVEYITNEALRETKQKYDNKVLTPDYLIDQINETTRDIRSNKNKLSWTQSFNAVLGATVQGTFIYDLPSDIYDKYSFKAIERVSLGGEIELKQVDPNFFFNTLMDGVHYTQCRTAAVATDTTLEIDNSYDFDDSGSVVVGSDTITYTGVTRSATAGVLTGVPASGDGAIPAAGISVDDYVLQNATTGEPRFYTIFNGSLYIYNLPDSAWDNFNINIDYFKTVTSVDSMDDTIDYIQYDLIKNRLKWKIRAIAENDGVEDLNDPSFVLYQSKLSLLIRKDNNLNARFFRNGYEFDDTQGDDISPQERRQGNALRF